MFNSVVLEYRKFSFVSIFLVVILGINKRNNEYSLIKGCSFFSIEVIFPLGTTIFLTIISIFFHDTLVSRACNVEVICCQNTLL